MAYYDFHNINIIFIFIQFFLQILMQYNFLEDPLVSNF